MFKQTKQKQTNNIYIYLIMNFEIWFKFSLNLFLI